MMMMMVGVVEVVGVMMMMMMMMMKMTMSMINALFFMVTMSPTKVIFKGPSLEYVTVIRSNYWIQVTGELDNIIYSKDVHFA